MDDARRAFEEAERAAAARIGLSYQSRYLALARPALRLRLLEAGEGRPLLLVHGGGGIGAQWAPLMARLPGFRAIAFDRPGCGLSDGFDYTGVPLRAHALEVMESLLDALGLASVDLVANSMGGLWSLWLAEARPERVASLVLLGCPALLLGSGAPAAMHLLAVPALARLAARRPPRSPEQTRKMLAMIAGAPAVAKMAAEMIECAWRAQLLPGARSSFFGLVGRALTPFGRRRESVFGADELRRVRQPTLFVWGDRDVFGAPSTGERACRLMPDARLEVVPGGHTPWMDEPDRCAELVTSFLARRAPA
jgi:pimeloyl-ACP methyl ester carboxylesterase